MTASDPLFVLAVMLAGLWQLGKWAHRAAVWVVSVLMVALAGFRPVLPYAKRLREAEDREGV